MNPESVHKGRATRARLLVSLQPLTPGRPLPRCADIAREFGVSTRVAHKHLRRLLQEAGVQVRVIQRRLVVVDALQAEAPKRAAVAMEAGALPR